MMSEFGRYNVSFKSNKSHLDKVYQYNKICPMKINNKRSTKYYFKVLL